MTDTTATFEHVYLTDHDGRSIAHRLAAEWAALLPLAVRDETIRQHIDGVDLRTEPGEVVADAVDRCHRLARAWALGLMDGRDNVEQGVEITGREGVDDLIADRAWLLSDVDALGVDDDEAAGLEVAYVAAWHVGAKSAS